MRMEIESLLKLWVVVRLDVVVLPEPLMAKVVWLADNDDIELGCWLVKSTLLFVSTPLPFDVVSLWLELGVSSLYHFSMGWLLSIELTGMFT